MTLCRKQSGANKAIRYIQEIGLSAKYAAINGALSFSHMVQSWQSRKRRSAKNHIQTFRRGQTMKKLEINRKKYGEVKKMDHRQMTQWVNDVFEAGYNMGQLDAEDENNPETIKAQGVIEFLETLQEGKVKGVGGSTLNKLIAYAIGQGYISTSN